MPPGEEGWWQKLQAEGNSSNAKGKASWGARLQSPWEWSSVLSKGSAILHTSITANSQLRRFTCLYLCKEISLQKEERWQELQRSSWVRCFQGDPASRATEAFAFENAPREAPAVLVGERHLKGSKCYFTKTRDRFKHQLYVFLYSRVRQLELLSTVWFKDRLSCSMWIQGAPTCCSQRWNSG